MYSDEFNVIWLPGVWDLAPFRWAESHLSILGADAYMFSALIQADLVDLHWTLWAEKSSSLKVLLNDRPARCKYNLKSKPKHLGPLDDITVTLYSKSHLCTNKCFHWFLFKTNLCHQSLSARTQRSLLFRENLPHFFQAMIDNNL